VSDRWNINNHEVMEITIREITVQDAEVFAELAKQTFYDTFTGTCTEKDMEAYLEEYYNLPKVEAELSTPDAYNYFAEVNNVPVGYIRFMEDYSDYPFEEKRKALELKRLYILKGFQGKGIAQELMNVYFHHANEYRYELAWLSVWEHNYKAQHFYKKYGFEYSGHQHPFPIGDTPQTDCWFWKFL
jgi:ribosomal protein S18 acetylase RimI-like enzyme